MLAPALPADEAERIAALYELEILDTEPEERFDRITRLGISLFRVPIAYIALVDSNRQWFKSACGLSFKESPRQTSFCGHAILQDDALVIPDTLADPRFADNPLVAGDPKIRFYAGHPIRSVGGQKIGTLCLVDRKPREFAEEETNHLRDMARMAEDQFKLVDVTELERDLRHAKARLEQGLADLEKRNAFIRQLLGAQISDEVADRMIESPEALRLGGDLRVVTVLMADLRGFTTLSQNLSAARTVETLNRYMEAMIEVILASGGTVDQLIGDGILATFGASAPMEKDAERAVDCARRMQREMEQVNAANARDGLPRLEMGIGVSRGEVIVGNIGSARRMKYSVIGSAVNLASRIEAFALGGQILVSESTRRELGAGFETVGSLRVKIRGVEGSVEIFDIGA